jgi:ferric enterobactin receptor
MVGTRDPWMLLAASATLLAMGGQAAAQTPAPNAPAASEAEEEADEIVVLAPADEARIDRRTYTIRNDPAAQATDMVDVLGRIPSVSVAPSGEIRLLGGSDVNVQINGQPVPAGGVEQILRGLTGGEIERIEVITNPSGQFSSEGTGGIINIITRQRFDRGFGGALTTGLDSFGGYSANFSPNWTGERWTLSGRANYGLSPEESDLDRERRDLGSGAVTTERGHTESERENFGGNAQAIYRPDERRRITFSADSFTARPDQEQFIERADASGPVETQRVISDPLFSHHTVSLDFQQNGAENERELLKFNALMGLFENNSDSTVFLTPEGGPTTSFATSSESQTEGVSAKLDYERPLDDEPFLTVGAAFEHRGQDNNSARQTLVGAPSPADYQSALEGIQQTGSGYATYQFETGDWTWLPSVRVESYRREIVSGGVEDDDVDVRTFPSLHVRRRLSSEMDIDLSYSSRIQRPSLGQLDPALRFFDANRASSGNPDLQPTTTDAYEANFNYQSGSRTFGITLYDRLRQDIASQFTETNSDGIIVTRPVNAGDSEQRGAQVILRGPLWTNWRYAASANFLNREFDVITSAGVDRRSEFEYSGNAQIEYRDPGQNEVNADFLQLDLQFQGPRFSLQGESDSFVSANFTWRRRLTRALSSVVTFQDMFDSADQLSEVTTDTYFERTEIDRAGQRVRLALTYQFGAPPPRGQQMDRPQQQPQPDVEQEQQF